MSARGSELASLGSSSQVRSPCIKKQREVHPPEDTTLSNHINLVFSKTEVVQEGATVAVFITATHTQLGKITKGKLENSIIMR
jgi:magnesium-transporting ATPase (P-type)